MWLLIFVFITGTVFAQTITRVDDDNYTVDTAVNHSLSADQQECDRLNNEVKRIQAAADSTCGFVNSVAAQPIVSNSVVAINAV